MPAVLIATSNQHKIEEIEAILGARFEFLTLKDFSGAPKPVEDAPDFAGNAAKKAVTLADWLASGKHQADYVLADDSGLEVDALGGAPGVHSARFAAIDNGGHENSPDADNNAKLLRLLAPIPAEKRTARFRCVIAFVPVPEHFREGSSPVCLASESELAVELFDGTCEGRILDAARGAHGFGYDPLFVPNGFEQTFAELGGAQKNAISHRSVALRKLRSRLGTVAGP